jgi:hypothetical protein
MSAETDKEKLLNTWQKRYHFDRLVQVIFLLV